MQCYNQQRMSVIDVAWRLTAVWGATRWTTSAYLETDQ
jgi:hypothetical protein